MPRLVLASLPYEAAPISPNTLACKAGEDARITAG